MIEEEFQETAYTLAIKAVNDAVGTDEAAQLIGAKVRGLLFGYDQHWGPGNRYETISVEEVFHLPVINPDTGRSSRTFTQAGKFDGIVSLDGRNLLLEHKSTSEEIADQDAEYWRILQIDAQVSAYCLANWQQGRKLEGTLYDVIKKPGIRPKQLDKATQKAIVAHKEYCSYPVSPAIALSIANGQDRECNTLYELRLARDTVENPNKYFQRRNIPRLDSEVLEYSKELWDVGQSLIHARAEEAHYRNSGACRTYNTPCEFLGICSGYDTPDSAKWSRKENVHSELPILGQQNGRDVLSHSRLKTFQTCRRKHFYKYELGIKRVDEEEREALYFGSLLHLGLEAWWSFFKKGGANAPSNASSPAVNEVAGLAQEELPV